MRSLRPFICERCLERVPHPEDRRVVSIDSTDEHTKTRYSRVMLGRFCLSCASLISGDVAERYSRHPARRAER